jgi:predicted transcriptional regulator
MAKRGKLEIVRDILKLIQENHKPIKVTPLLRKSNVSSKRFYGYLDELLQKRFVMRLTDEKCNKCIKITEKGTRYLERYKTIVNFIDEFEL